MKLRGIQVPMQSPSMSEKEPVERGEGDQGDHQTNDVGRDGLFIHVQMKGRQLGSAATE